MDRKAIYSSTRSTHEIGSLLSEVVEYFQQFFMHIADGVPIEDHEKAEILKSLYSCRDKVDRVIDIVDGL